MGQSPSAAPASRAAVQTASRLRSCEVCGAEVRGERTVTCSDPCRSERCAGGRSRPGKYGTPGGAGLLREAM
jgi:hypothetical protein